MKSSILRNCSKDMFYEEVFEKSLKTKFKKLIFFNTRAASKDIFINIFSILINKTSANPAGIEKCLSEKFHIKDRLKILHNNITFEDKGDQVFVWLERLKNK